ncbi:MAG: 3-isopropylmalate dehydrogenase [Chromatiales bacterium]|nr:3-isopropylmalate dehydrogenase [Chromatiales bacterium]
MADAKHILLLPGDGIGPEVIAEAVKLIKCLQSEGLNIAYSEGLIGGTAYDACGKPLPDETLAAARSSDAILMGAVGAPQYEKLPREARPEQGLLAIRKELGLFANLRPAMLFKPLATRSSLRTDLIEGLDILIVRELTGGIYFGEPRGKHYNEDHLHEAYNTMVYNEDEIMRIARMAYQAAAMRGKRLCSVDKANVLEVSELWREVVESLRSDYSDVELTHLYVDNAAMQLVREPKQFDVIVTSNLFGDILSDLAAMLTGSIGMLPSASLDSSNKGLYEPVHGSAPDIAGRGCANPLAAILSLAMLLRYSLEMSDPADRIEQAVAQALETHRTPDIAAGSNAVSTAEMGDAVVRYYNQAVAG